MNTTTCTITLVLLLLTGIPLRVAGAGTCACDNNGNDLFGTTEKCWETAGTAKTTCTVAANHAGNVATACAAVTNCAWKANVCIEGGADGSSTTTCTDPANEPACTAISGCQWNPGKCVKLSSASDTWLPNLCSTYLNQTDCETDNLICEWDATPECSAGCSGLHDQAGCELRKNAATVLCKWAAISDNILKFCGCAFEGKLVAGTPTCHATAAESAAYCTSATSNATTAGKCAATGERIDFCSWFEGGPIPSAFGTCACDNPGLDEAGTTEKCWKTAGTAKTVCTAATTEALCTAASVNDGDCAFATNACGCANTGQIGSVLTCFKDVSQDPTFCTGTKATPVVGGTAANACGHATVAAYCEWMMPDFPKPATAGTCACVNPHFDANGNLEKCWSTAGTLLSACALLNADEATCIANTDCAWTATGTVCGCANPGKNAAGADLCFKDAAQAVTYCSDATVKGAAAGQCGDTTGSEPKLSTFCKWMIAESACPATATPTPCPSSAVAPGALLAFLATALAFLRC